MTKQAEIKDIFLTKISRKYEVEKGKTQIYPTKSGSVYLREKARKNDSEDEIKKSLSVVYAFYQPADAALPEIPYVTVSLKNSYGNDTIAQFDGDPAQEMIDEIEALMLDSQIEALK